MVEKLRPYVVEAITLFYTKYVFRNSQNLARSIWTSHIFSSLKVFIEGNSILTLTLVFSPNSTLVSFIPQFCFFYTNINPIQIFDILQIRWYHRKTAKLFFLPGNSCILLMKYINNSGLKTEICGAPRSMFFWLNSHIWFWTYCILTITLCELRVILDF